MSGMNWREIVPARLTARLEDRPSPRCLYNTSRRDPLLCCSCLWVRVPETWPTTGQHSNVRKARLPCGYKDVTVI